MSDTDGALDALTPAQWESHWKRKPVITAMLVRSFAESALNNCDDDHPAKAALTEIVAICAEVQQQREAIANDR